MSASLSDLLTESQQLGHLGPGPIATQIAHAIAFAAAAPSAPARALDLGAGGGLPGLVLAARAWPAAWWCLLDARTRRVAFLEHAVARLGLEKRTEVVAARAEEVGRNPEHRGRYDLVVSRSFGSPGVTAECAAPLLAIGGHLVVSEPPASDVVLRWPADGLAEVGIGPPTAVAIDTPAPSGSGRIVAHLVVLKLVGEVPDRYPRRVGVPAKRPVF